MLCGTMVDGCAVWYNGGWPYLMGGDIAVWYKLAYSLQYGINVSGVLSNWNYRPEYWTYSHTLTRGESMP